LAFVMLTGQPPFDHPETAEIMFQHLQKEPPRARSLRPEIGEPLEVLIDALLSKRPDDRPASVDEVRAALLPRRRLHD
jgi:serine/threonine-protein kinase